MLLKTPKMPKASTEGAKTVMQFDLKSVKKWSRFTVLILHCSNEAKPCLWHIN